MDFGSGTLELRIQTKNGLDDGVWHRIDLFWTREEVRMIVDFCQTSIVVEHEDGTPTKFDDKACQTKGNFLMQNFIFFVKVQLLLNMSINDRACQTMGKIFFYNLKWLPPKIL